MTIETRLRNTNFPPGGGGGGSSTAGLAGSGNYYIVASASATLPFSYVPVQGTNITFAYSGSNFTITATTGSGAANSAGLAGTGPFYLLQTSGNSTLPFSKLITAGSSITTRTDATSFYIDATTATPIAYAASGSYFIVGSSQPLLPGSRILTAGSSISMITDSTAFYVTALTPNVSTFVSNSRQVLSLFPLSGGGDLTADRTFSANTAFIVTSNRNINTTYPLAGGGNLGADQTHTIDTSFLITSNRTISTTSPLGGGGNLGNNLTFTVGSLSSIGSANQIFRTSSGGTTWEYVNLVGGSSITVSSVSGKIQIDASTGGGASSNSGGLAGTGFFYLFQSSGTGLYPNSRLFSSGSSITTRTDATNFYVDASTAGLAFQSTAINTTYPLAGGGDFSTTRTYTIDTAFLVNTARQILTTSPVGGGGNLSADRTITVGSLSTIGSANQFIRVNTDGSTWGYINFRAGSSTILSQGSGFIQIDASTGGAASNSGGLASTGGLYVVTSASPLFPNSRILKAGSSVTIITDSTSIYITALTNGGSGTPGGSDSQIQVNSQNLFAGFPNLRWIGSSNSLDLNTAGRIRHGGVAEVDGVSPTGVTGLLWLDTSGSTFTTSSAGLAGTGAYYVLQSGNSTLPNSQILTAGSSVIVRTGGGNIYIDALTSGGASGSQNPDFIGAYPISNLNWKRIYITGLTSGITDMFTCPSGNRVALISYWFINTGNKNIISQILVKSSGTYYYPAGSITSGPGGSFQAGAGSYILEGGNSISCSVTSNNGLNIIIGAYIFDTSTNLKTVNLASYNSGFNILYTAPMTGNSILLNTTVFPPSGNNTTVATMNSTGTTRNVSIAIVPSGQTASSVFAASNTSQLTNSSKVTYAINASFNSGDTIQISTDVNTAGLFSFLTVYEAP